MFLKVSLDFILLITEHVISSELLIIFLAYIELSSIKYNLQLKYMHNNCIMDRFFVEVSILQKSTIVYRKDYSWKTRFKKQLFNDN